MATLQEKYKFVTETQPLAGGHLKGLGWDKVTPQAIGAYEDPASKDLFAKLQQQAKTEGRQIVDTSLGTKLVVDPTSTFEESLGIGGLFANNQLDYMYGNLQKWKSGQTSQYQENLNNAITSLRNNPDNPTAKQDAEKWYGMLNQLSPQQQTLENLIGTTTPEQQAQIEQQQASGADFNIAGTQKTDAQVYGQPLTLPSGQTIDPADPNYATYAKQLGVEQTIAETPTTDQQFTPIKPSELLQGTDLNESDLARTTGDNIYRRDLAAEQAKIDEFIKMTDKMPQTDQDWREFHDFVYEGKSPMGIAEEAALTEEGQVGVDETAMIETDEEEQQKQEMQSNIESKGYTLPDSNQSPYTYAQDLIKQVYSDMGLDTVKENIKTIGAEIQAIDDKLADEITTITDNPWISEALRSRKIESATNKSEAKKGNLIARLSLEESLLDSIKEEARYITNQGLTIAFREQDWERDLMLKAMDNAEKEQEFQRELGIKYGYEYISDPEELAGLSEDRIYRDPTGRIYKKPVEPVKGGSGGGAGGAGYISVGNEQIVETGDTFTDTTNYLKSLRDQGMLTDFNYKEQIDALMEVGGYTEEERGEVESMVNQAMEGKIATADEIEQDNNISSDFIVESADAGGVYKFGGTAGETLEKRATRLINSLKTTELTDREIIAQARQTLLEEGYPKEEIYKIIPKQGIGGILESLGLVS